MQNNWKLPKGGQVLNLQYDSIRAVSPQLIVPQTFVRVKFSFANPVRFWVYCEKRQKRKSVSFAGKSPITLLRRWGRGKISIISFRWSRRRWNRNDVFALPLTCEFIRTLSTQTQLRSCWLNCQRSKLFFERLFLLIYIADSTMQWKSLKANSFQWRHEEKYSCTKRRKKWKFYWRCSQKAQELKNMFLLTCSWLLRRRMQIHDI